MKQNVLPIMKGHPYTYALRLSSQMLFRAILLGSVSTSLTFAAGGADQTIRFDIPGQSVESALIEFSKQADMQVMLRSTAVAGQQASGVKGRLSVPTALSRLLQNTNLTYETTTQNTITVKPLAAAAKADLGETELEQTRSNKATDSQPAQVPATTELSTSSDERRRSTVPLEEVVVTGTHIRGVTSSASPIQVYDRDEIDRTGLGSLQEFMQRLPQNFSGGASEDTLGPVNGGGTAVNQVNGTGVNLRGLGNDSTLVLLDGRRIAPGNLLGNFVDVSLIPLAAIERVEVVPDGASALYGSDAVGGVVNFILRRDFSGAETRARYGSVSEGNSEELQLGQTLGYDWSSGSTLLSYEYFDRTPLNADERAYTQEARDPLTLIPKQVRHSAFLTVNHAITPNAYLFADGLYSERSTFRDTTTRTFALHRSTEISAYVGTLGARVALSPGLQLEVSSSYGASDTGTEDFRSGLQTGDTNADTKVITVDPTISGSLWTTRAGTTRFAVGGQFRKEEFDVVFRHFPAADDHRDRDVVGGFVELRVPLVGPSPAIPSASRLELTLADRYEEYSDFGSTNNPHLGLIWRATKGLAFRGTYGTSFKAPLLNDLQPVPFQVFPLAQFDPLTGLETNVLVVLGGNPDLEPEEATTWTFGVDLNPERLPGLRTHLTYYDITFEGRITNARFNGFDIFDALRHERILGPAIISRNPSSTLIQRLVATPGYEDLLETGIDPFTVGAIIDDRSHNLAVVNTNGIDFGLSYTAESGSGTIETGIDGTYILEFANRFTSTAPTVEILNKPYNPIDLKLRARGIIQRSHFTLSAFVNYIDSYVDARSGTSHHVESWTTADLTLGYKPASVKGMLSGVSAMLGVINLTDEDPPRVRSEFPGTFTALDFDGANANVLGRFYSLQVSKRW